VTKFILGQRVRYSKPLQRVTTTEFRNGQARTMKRWVRWPYHWTGGDYPGIQGTGFIVGKRTLQNGERYYIGYEEGLTFVRTPGEDQEAYMVAFDLRRKPIFVLEGDLEEVGDDE
jgi:hypothetical protein